MTCYYHFSPGNCHFSKQGFLPEKASEEAIFASFGVEFEKNLFSLYPETMLTSDGMKQTFFFLIFLAVLGGGCTSKQKTPQDATSPGRPTYTNPLLPQGAEPWAVFRGGYYYYTQGEENKIILRKTKDITGLKEAETKIVWLPPSREASFHLWGPELHFIGGKWYIYFAGDDGNMDNHQIYVLENEAADPLAGEFTMKGSIPTDPHTRWAIHASCFEHAGRQYMIWCGWKQRRISEEIQCIYLAPMKNPWTLDGERVLISEPEYEWERQWVNPDGSKTAYPIHVNEAPQFFQSKNRDKLLIYYCASGSWTPYYCIGLLTADAGSDLLGPASWRKSPEPVFLSAPENGVYGPGSPSFIPSPDGKEWYMLYHARRIPNDAPGALDSRSPRLQKIDWDAEGMPVLGIPQKEGIALPCPSGTVKAGK